MKLNTSQKICLGFFGLLIIFWIALFINGSTISFYNYLYSFLFGLIPFIGGFVTMIRSRVWGTFKSAVGKAVFFIGLGLFCWGSGEMTWSYYNFFMGIPAPYPSLADIGFAPSIFFYGLGAVYLSKATGAKFALRNKYAKVFAVIAPIGVLLISYYVLIIIARGGVFIPPNEPPLKAFLDIAYPFGDFVALTLSVVISGLSFKYLGGRYKLDIFAILSGLGVMFIADSLFSYTTTAGTYYNGDIGDLALTIGMFLLTFGVLGFYRLKED